MFWYILLFHRHSPRAPAEIARDYEHSDLFYSPSPPGKTALAKTNAVQNKGENLKWKKMKVNEPGSCKSGQRNNSWQWEKHAWLYSDPLQALKGETTCQLGLLNRGNCTSASAVPHFVVLCEIRVVRLRHNDSKNEAKRRRARYYRASVFQQQEQAPQRHKTPLVNLEKSAEN